MPRLRNTKQERFARGVAALEPLATAYREAGYGGDPRWHPFNASRLANTPPVKARIDELRTEFERLSAIHVEYIRAKLLELIEVDAKELYEPDPNDLTGRRLRLRSLTELPTRLSRAISGVKLDPVTGAPVEIKFAGKVEAAAALLRSLPGGSIERREITGKDGAPLRHEDVSALSIRERARAMALIVIKSRVEKEDRDAAGIAGS
jgi:hypothetical protein